MKIELDTAKIVNFFKAFHWKANMFNRLVALFLIETGIIFWVGFMYKIIEKLMPPSCPSNEQCITVSGFIAVLSFMAATVMNGIAVFSDD